MVIPDELLSDEQGVGDAAGHRLLRIKNRNTELTSVPQQGAEGVRLLGRDDDQNLGYARLHKHGNRIVDQGLVVDRQQGLAHRLSHRVEAGALTRCQNNTFHRDLLKVIII